MELLPKDVNTVPEAVPVWPLVRYISDTGVPFRVYRYFIYIYIYVCVCVCVCVCVSVCVYIYIYYNKYKSLP